MIRPFAFVVAAACALPAHAQSTVQLSGTVDLAAGRIQSAGALRTWRADDGGLSPSFISFNGYEDIGGGLKVRFALEHELRLDLGQAGRVAGDPFWSRNAYVGFAGNFGTSTLGRHTTLLMDDTRRFNAFGESLAFSPAVRQLFTPVLLPFYGDWRWNNSLRYTSNNFDGVTVRLLVNFAENSVFSNGKNWSGSAVYERGPLALGAVFQKVKNGTGTVPAGFHEQSAFQLGASYDFHPIAIYGLATRVQTQALVDNRTTLYSLGGKVAVGSAHVLAQFGQARANASGTSSLHRTFSLGYDYALSKRTDLYAIAMRDAADGLRTGHSLAGGIRTSF